jgi:hypothetical protein
MRGLGPSGTRTPWQYFHYQWTEGNPWPPVDYVLRAGLWRDPAYEEQRQRLLRPAPDPTVTFSSSKQYVTVDACSKAMHAGGQITGAVAADRCAPQAIALCLSAMLCSMLLCVCVTCQCQSFLVSLYSVSVGLYGSFRWNGVWLGATPDPEPSSCQSIRE